MTLIVGILCSDGAVLASDSAATFGTPFGQYTLGQQPSLKVRVIDDSVLFATSGAVGLSQSMFESVKQAWKDRKIGTDEIAAKENLSTVLRRVLGPAHEAARNAVGVFQQHVLAQDVTCSTIVCVPCVAGARVFQFGLTGQGEAASERLPFVAIGSGQPLAEPFLAFLRRVFWPDRLPTVADAIFAAAWTVDHVCKTNAGGVGGDLQLATLERKSGKWIAQIHQPERLLEHTGNFQAAEAYLARYGKAPRAEPEAPAPPIPPKP